MVVGHRQEDLRREDEGVARIVLEDLPPGGLRCPAPVAVGRVEERDAGVERRAGARLGLFALDATGISEPRAESDLRYFDPAVAELSFTHLKTVPRADRINRRRSRPCRRGPPRYSGSER